jgi:hypothetical protein
VAHENSLNDNGKNANLDQSQRNRKEIITIVVLPLNGPPLNLCVISPFSFK